MVAWLAFLSLLLGVDPVVVSPELEELVKVAAQTRERIDKEQVRWSSRMGRDEDPAGIETHVIRGLDRSRFDLKVVTQRGTRAVGSVLVRDDHWLLTDGPYAGEYRPFEAPLPLPAAAIHLNFSDLRLVTKELLALPGIRVQSATDDRVILRSPLDDALRANFQAALDKMNELAESLKGAQKALPPSAVATMASLEDLLANGSRTVIDRRTGQVLESGNGAKRLKHSALEWLGTEPLRELEDPPGKWPDHTKPLTADELKEMVQLGNNPVWNPNFRGAGDPDLLIANVVTGDVRRVPFRGVLLPGCFSKDRTKIYACGPDFNSGAMHLFEVDLTTGKSRPIQNETLMVGTWLSPVLSPDGNRLALIKGGAGRLLNSQIYLVDLTSGKTTPVGQPMDVAMLNWHPDGDALICRVLEKNPEGEAAATVVRVSLDGEVKKLCSGNFPEVLIPERRILFKDSNDDNLFHTCDLNGDDVEAFGDGFAGFGFPSSSDDGRLIMIKYEKDQIPQPCLIDTRTLKTTPLSLGPGLWMLPRFR